MRVWKRLLSVVLLLSVVSMFCSCSSSKKKKEKYKYNIGEEITLGSYMGQGVEWIVLDVNDEGDALIISKYILDMIPYDQDARNVTWEKCTLRTWLNNDFFNSAFSEEEQSRILLSKLKNPDSVEFGIPGGNDTEDRIFLLSLDEANSLFASSKDRRCKPTDYALDKGIMTSSKGSSAGCAPWWLRSPGRDAHSAAAVRDFGYVLSSGYNVYYEGYGVRPALWISASA